MRIVAAPEIANETFSRWLAGPGAAMFPEVLRLAQTQQDYLPWSKVRHTAPQGLPPEVWWSALCLARNPSVIDARLVGVGGRPFLLAFPPELRRLLQGIDRNAPVAVQTVGAGGAKEVNALRRAYLQREQMLEAIASSQMEGAATTRRMAQAMLREARSPQTEGERMIVNNYATIRALDEWREEPLSENLLFRIHRTLTEGLLPEAERGRYRTTDDIHVRTPTDDIAHLPPPAATLPTRLEALFAFANRQGGAGGDLPHPVVKAVLLHTLLAYEHPFCDGNGRTARALFYWSLLHDGWWVAPYVSISRLLRQERKAYDEAYLDMETCHLDTTYCVLANVRIFARGLRTLNAVIERGAARARAWRDLFKGQLNARQLDLLEHALRHPNHHYRIHEHQQWHAIANNTARADFDGLEAHGFLKRRKIGRDRYYTDTGLFRSLAERLGAPA